MDASLKPLDAVDGKAAQVVTEVVPGVEIPSIAVMHEPLRGNPALGLLIASARVIRDANTLPLQRGTCYGAKRLTDGPCGGTEYADALFDAGKVQTSMRQQLVDSRC
jgi:hypothetical protein